MNPRFSRKHFWILVLVVALALLALLLPRPARAALPGGAGLCGSAQQEFRIVYSMTDGALLPGVA
jgi:hypothetical protein